MRKNKHWLNYQLTATSEKDKYVFFPRKYSVNGSLHGTVSELKTLGRLMQKLCLQIVSWSLSVEHIFSCLFKNHSENEAGRLVPELFFVWKSFI